MNVLGYDVLLISSYSLGKADVNYRAGSKLPDSSVRKVVSLAMLNPGDALSRRCAFADALRLAHVALARYVLSS